MAMNPMTPARLPTPAAFKLLADLNEFFALPLKDRQAMLDAYMAADDQRQTALDKLESRNVSASEYTAEAVRKLEDATATAKATVDGANTQAGVIIATATEQAASVTATARQTVASANADARVIEAEASTRLDGIAEAEDAVKAREGAVADREELAEQRIVDAELSKAQYDGLMRDINALRPRAPK